MGARALHAIGRGLRGRIRLSSRGRVRADLEFARARPHNEVVLCCDSWLKLLGALGLLGWVGVGSIRCTRTEPIPTEKLLVVKAPFAPGLPEPGRTVRSSRTVYWGEVFYPRTRLPDLEWEGHCEGRVMRRKGSLEVGRAPLHGGTFVFESDLIEADVPTSGWLCSQMGNPAVRGSSCAQALQRVVVTSGKLVAYVRCVDQRCPLAELSGGKITTTAVAGLTHVRVVHFGPQQAVLAWRYWSQSPNWTGTRLAIFATEPPLGPLGELGLDEVDSRDAAEVMNRLGTLETLDDGIRFSGVRRILERTTGRELSSAPFDERFTMPPVGAASK